MSNIEDELVEQRQEDRIEFMQQVVENLLKCRTESGYALAFAWDEVPDEELDAKWEEYYREGYVERRRTLRREGASVYSANTVTKEALLQEIDMLVSCFPDREWFSDDIADALYVNYGDILAAQDLVSECKKEVEEEK